MIYDAPRAHRCAVPSEEPLIGPERYDYADSFEIEVPRTDSRSPEQMFRMALTQARWLAVLVPPVHRYVLGLRLAPKSSPDHLLGWRIVKSDPDVLELQAISPLTRAIILGRKSTERATFTTYLFYERPLAARTIWAVVSPLHRAVAPYLLRCAAATAPATRESLNTDLSGSADSRRSGV